VLEQCNTRMDSNLDINRVNLVLSDPLLISSILSFFLPEEVTSFLRVCKTWYSVITTHPSLRNWEKAARDRWPDWTSKLLPDTNWRGMYLSIKGISFQRMPDQDSRNFTKNSKIIIQQGDPFIKKVIKDIESKQNETGVEGGQQKKFEVTVWNPVASWSWDYGISNCAICRNHQMDYCIECQALKPAGDEKIFEDDVIMKLESCVEAWGVCNHSYHFHCIERWLTSRKVCPLDNMEWAYMSIGEYKCKGS